MRQARTGPATGSGSLRLHYCSAGTGRLEERGERSSVQYNLKLQAMAGQGQKNFLKSTPQGEAKKKNEKEGKGPFKRGTRRGENSLSAC